MSLTANYNFLFPQNTRKEVDCWSDYFSLALDTDYLAGLKVEDEGHIPASSLNWNQRQKRRELEDHSRMRETPK